MALSAYQAKRETVVILGVYYATLLIFLIASFFPQHRVWGINWWAYYPGYVPWVLFAVGAVIPLVLRFLRVRDESSPRRGGYLFAVISLVVLFGLAFYLLRAQTHFLGDGYQILSILASDNSFIKPTERGEALVHLWVFRLLGGEGESTALLSYQIASIAAGILFLIAVAVCAGFLFERTRDRILFTLGLSTGGYMLLFFGYVENYSLFVFSVTVYSLTGLLVVKGKISRWFILPPLGLAIFFHVLGVTLIPSTIYLLLVNSKPGNVIARLSLKTKLVMGAIGVVAASLVFYYYYTTDYFLRFAIVPLFENRFTVEGYTMFSLKHIVDYLNLLILLLPGLPIVIAALFFLPVRRIFKQREYRYLFILLASTLGAAFIFDPKLGMPRDWDLFSFAGVPLVMFFYHLILHYRHRVRKNLQLTIMLISFGFLSILPRSVSEVLEVISFAHAETYADLDKVRGRTARANLLNYCDKLNRSDKADQLRLQWHDELTQDNVLLEAAALIDERKAQRAIPLLKHYIEIDPLSPGAWKRLGECYAMLRQYDSALVFFTLAHGLNPYNAGFRYDIGLTFYLMENYQKAEEFFLKTLEIDSQYFLALNGLANVYMQCNDSVKYTHIMLKIATLDEASVELLVQVTEYYLKMEEYDLAVQTFQRAVEKGLDTVYVKTLLEKYPQLAK
jgi:tetratricopeptide (TPR) repeat protein